MSHCLKTNKQTCYGLVHLPMPIEMRRFAYQCFRKSSASKTAQSGTQPLSQASASVAAGSDMGKNLERATETAESLVPMMPSSFIDAKGGTDLIINSYGPIIKNNTKKKWLFFQDTKKIKVEQVIHPCEENPLQSAA